MMLQTSCCLLIIETDEWLVTTASKYWINSLSSSGWSFNFYVYFSNTFAVTTLMNISSAIVFAQCKWVITILTTNQHWFMSLLGAYRQQFKHFAEDISKFSFLNENAWISPKISLKCVAKVRIDNIPALVQIMVWRLPGDKPLYTDQCWLVYWRIYASLGLDITSVDWDPWRHMAALGFDEF